MFIGGHIRVYISRDRVDLRKSYEGLGLLVQDTLCLDALSGHLFVFFNKRLDKIKALYWDGDGFCLWQKRLERGSFKVSLFEASYLSLSLNEFQMLLSGLDLTRLPKKAALKHYVMR